MPEPSPVRPHLGSQEVLRISEISNGGEFESAGKEKEGLDGEGYEVRHYELKENFGVEDGKTGELFLSEDERVGARDQSEQEEGAQGGEEEEEEAQLQSTRKPSKIPTADNNPTRPAPHKKHRNEKRPRKPTARMLGYGTRHYPRYDATIQNQGAAVKGSSRNPAKFDGYALYINPDLKDTELEQIPHSGVRVDDLTASKLLLHYDRKTLHTRWPADFDQKGMVPAERVGLGRAAKRWVNQGEEDVDEKLVEQAGWYYLSWGGIHTLMGMEGTEADRYWVRPSHERFKCRGLGFKISDWAEVQLAPEDPADPTSLL